MNTSFLSLIFAGVVGGGTLLGSIQQNVLKPQKIEYDLLFEEIEKDIKEFSEKNHINEKNLWEVKSVAASEESKKSNLEEKDDKKQEAKYTLSVWTTIWISLLDGYIHNLWIGKETNVQNLSENLESRNFSLEDKQRAIDEAEKNIKNEKVSLNNEIT